MRNIQQGLPLVDDAATFSPGGSVSIDVLANDPALVPWDALSLRVVDVPAHGTVSLDSLAGELVYQHDGSQDITDQFSYTLENLVGQTAIPGFVYMTRSGFSSLILSNPVDSMLVPNDSLWVSYSVQGDLDRVGGIQISVDSQVVYSDSLLLQPILITRQSRGSHQIKAVLLDTLGNVLPELEASDSAFVYWDAPYALTTGDAFGSATNSSCFVLTSGSPYEAGAMWLYDSLDLSADIDLQFEANFGNNDLGADGMTFMLQLDSSGYQTLGQTGVSLGAGGVSPSFGVEFDTYYNGYLSHEQPEDHVSLFVNGDLVNAVAGPFCAIDQCPNIEDGQSHLIRIVWEVSNYTFSVYVDGSLRLSWTQDIASQIFGGHTKVLGGFTGSTGSNYNLQEVCLVNGNARQLPRTIAQHTFPRMQVFPNPTEGQVSLRMLDAYEGLAHMRLINPMGQIIATEKIDLKSGIDAKITLPEVAGIYILSMEVEGHLQQFRIVNLGR
ncbi:MAG: Ig-like domain-containing protein [Bacteroidota bacterium]